MKKIGIIILFGAVAIGALFYTRSQKTTWTTYTNETMGIRIDHPAEFSPVYKKSSLPGFIDYLDLESKNTMSKYTVTRLSIEEKTIPEWISVQNAIIKDKEYFMRILEEKKMNDSTIFFIVKPGRTMNSSADGKRAYAEFLTALIQKRDTLIEIGSVENSAPKSEKADFYRMVKSFQYNPPPEPLQ